MTGPGAVAGAAQPPVGTNALAHEVVAIASRRQLTIAVAESLTGGLLGAAITAVPGASVVFRGGVISYATQLKAALLGVPTALLEARGAVDPGVAAAMADGVRTRLGATLGAATTGVAGPEPAEGKPPGTVYIAVAAGQAPTVVPLSLAGSRDEIRDTTVEQCLRLLWAALVEEPA